MYLFVVPGDGDTLLGMPDIDLFNILQSNCKMKGTKKDENDTNYNQIKKNTINAGSDWCCTNTGLEKDCDKKDNDAVSCTNIGNSSNSNNRPLKASLPMVKDNVADYLLSGTIETNNEIEYFPSGPNNEDEKRATANITRQIRKEFEDVFRGIGCFEGMFSLQVKLDSKPYQVPL